MSESMTGILGFYNTGLVKFTEELVEYRAIGPNIWGVHNGKYLVITRKVKRGVRVVLRTQLHGLFCPRTGFNETLTSSIDVLGSSLETKRALEMGFRNTAFSLDNLEVPNDAVARRRYLTTLKSSSVRSVDEMPPPQPLARPLLAQPLAPSTTTSLRSSSTLAVFVDGA